MSGENRFRRLIAMGCLVCLLFSLAACGTEVPAISLNFDTATPAVTATADVTATTQTTATVEPAGSATAAPSAAASPATTDEPATTDGPAQPVTLQPVTTAAPVDSGGNDNSVPDNFTAGAGYGTVYPFFARLYGSISSEQSCLYGFADGQGRVVCRAAYEAVKTITRDGTRMYVACRYEGDTVRVAVIGQSGGWVYRYDMPYAARGWLEQLDNDWQGVPVYNGSQWGAVGFDGALLTDYHFSAPVCVRGDVVCEGVTEGNRYCVNYYRLDGSKIIGPLTLANSGVAARAFALMGMDGGLSLYMDENGYWGYADNGGSPKYPASFTNAERFSNGQAVATERNGQSYALDATGNSTPYDGARSLLGYGLALVSTGGGLKLANADTLAALPISVGDSTAVVAMDGQTVALLDGNGLLRICATDGRQLANVQLPQGSRIVQAGPQADGLVMVLVQGNAIQQEQVLLYDASGQALLPPMKRVECYGSLFAVSDGHDAGLMDRSGRWLLKQALSNAYLF